MPSVKLIQEEWTDDDEWIENKIAELEYDDPEYLVVVVDGEPLFKLVQESDIEIRDGMACLEDS